MADLETGRGTAPGGRLPEGGRYLSDDTHFLLFTKRTGRHAREGVSRL
jgi:hypothetical protein